MTAVLWAAAAFCAALGGFAALSLAMDRHYEDSFGRGSEPGPLRRWLQAGGALSIVLSLGVSLALAGSSLGWVLWLGELTAGAMAVVLVLTYAPAKAMPLAGITAVAAVLATLGGALLR